jgi:UDP-2-acetamido-2,6-beta-L-arabino-hexul-4-ose reductase
MNLLVTGAKGFIGKNFISHASQISTLNIATFDKGQSLDLLENLTQWSDQIIHLAGVNRPIDNNFNPSNVDLTNFLCNSIRRSKKLIPIFFASSTQAELLNEYGKSKKLAEMSLQTLSLETGNPIIIYRLPGIFGKWCKPFYNSVVATFCHNISHNLPIEVHDASRELELLYIDDLIHDLLNRINDNQAGFSYATPAPTYRTSLGELANQISEFHSGRGQKKIERVGSALTRALYSTYLSYLEPDQFSYPLNVATDSRGMFVEMLKTPDCGQLSYFTAHPGITRGEHYHHSKSEKFLVVQGQALFRFRHIITNEYYEILVDGKFPTVVDSIPGWSHNIANVGETELIVMLWANEVFNPMLPDTIHSKV